MVKHLKNKMDQYIDDPRVVDERTPFAIREAYKSLYTNVRYLNIEGKCKKIAVTSAVSCEGKTTVSVNLALTLAQNLEDKRILLIDADMRCPKVASALGLNTKARGLSEYLAGIDGDPNFEYVAEHKLMVLTAGGPNANPTKLISSERMRKLLDACEEEFDYVIIDTPPVTVVTDAALMVSNVNGYIIAIRSEYSNMNKLNECVASLEQVGGEIFGFVLSDVKVKKDTGKYSRYGDNV
nr:CpsD/CapB family tyrosine-protein kinase [Oscillospiraceae bacterium]